MFMVTANPPTGRVESGSVEGPGKRATVVVVPVLSLLLPLVLLVVALLESEAASAAAALAAPSTERAPLAVLLKDREPTFQWRSLDRPPLPVLLPLPLLSPHKTREDEAAAEGKRVPRSATVFPSVFTSSLSEKVISVAPAPPLPLPCVNTLAINTNSILTPKRLA